MPTTTKTTHEVVVPLDRMGKFEVEVKDKDAVVVGVRIFCCFCFDSMICFVCGNRKRNESERTN